MLEKMLADYVRKNYFGQTKEPVKIGVYRPSVLSWSCIRKQWNYYKFFHKKKQEEIPDNVVLLLGGGIVFHLLLQQLKLEDKRFWDDVEVECHIGVNIGNSRIKIVGHADAIKNRIVYEFKHTRTLPNKPYFQHQLQLNFYLAALRSLRGVLVYTGYDASGGLSIKEFPIFYSDWHLEHLITRCQTLHTFLTTNQAPRCSCRDRIHENVII